MAGNKLCVATLNVRGLRNRNKRRKIFNWIAKQNIDLCCLQETYFTKEMSNEIANDWEGDIHHCFKTLLIQGEYLFL